MIGSLRGEILERDLDGSVLIEVGGVGYVVHVSEAPSNTWMSVVEEEEDFPERDVCKATLSKHKDWFGKRRVRN